MTALFEPQSGPRVLAVPVGTDFARALVAGLHARMAPHPPEAWPRLTIWFNTRRMQRRVAEVLAEDGRAMLLPALFSIEDLGDHLPSGPPPADPWLSRLLHLSRLVTALLARESQPPPLTGALDLAESLIDLLDDLHDAGLPVEALHSDDLSALTGDLSAHWHRNLAFLRLLADYLGALGPDALPGPAARLQAVVAALAARWRDLPPPGPVILAGSTGSRGVTRALMAAVAHLPQGAVVLPGLDRDLPAALWPTLGPEHPQHALARALDSLGLTPDQVPAWADVQPANPARGRLVSLSLRPAPVTDQWMAEAPALAPHLHAACDGLALIEAESTREEAQIIALRLAQAAQEGHRAALVTPDRVLARRVAAELARWHILPDDSAGQPLPLSPPGLFLRLIAQVQGQPPEPARLAALLQHPLCATGGGPEGRLRHLTTLRQMEQGLLRGGPPMVSGQAVRAWAAGAGRVGWGDWLAQVLDTLSDPGTRSLPDWAAQARATAETLSAGPQDSQNVGTQPGRLWDEDSGRTLRKALDEITGPAPDKAPGPGTGPGTGSTFGPDDWRALLQRVLSRQQLRPDPRLAHPLIAIWGTLEARVQSADLVILGGLNEGTWPARPPEDPWLGREMRAYLGLPLPEARIGLAGHDFQLALGAPQVVLSRAIRQGDAECVAARWLIRLLQLLGGTGEAGKQALTDMRARGQALRQDALALDRPAARIAPASRPAPIPPLSARPRRLSVTRIETLIRDPYAIYASQVLRLRKLDPLGRQPDVLERGTVLHRVFEQFVQATPGPLPADAHTLLDTIAAQVLQDLPWPLERVLWRARLARTAPWFVQTEAERRSRATPALQEAEGALVLDLPGGIQATLSAKADRIDIGPDGLVAIYDYKSGGLPSAKQVRRFSLQLPLEGLIAQEGGFAGLAPAARVHLELIGLGTHKVLGFDEGAEFDVMQDIFPRIRGLLAAYCAGDTPFFALSRPELQAFDGDYNHLARQGEWTLDSPFDVQVVG